MPSRAASPSVWVAVFALIVLLSQGFSLVHRARNGTSDFSVFYRSGQLVADGAGGELFEEPDERNGWARALPPAGLAPFSTLSRLPPAAAGSVWAVFNLLLVGLSAGLVLRLVDLAGAKRDGVEWAFAILFGLSAVSLQVGQFSILFTTCWLAALWALATRRDVLGGLCLALPVTVKLYPVFVVPAILSRTRWGRVVPWFGVGVILFGLVLPLIWLGPRAVDLTAGFLREIIFSPDGRVATYQRIGPGSVTNQGLDAVLARYLTHSPAFHDRYALPHADVGWLMGWISGAVRIAVIGVTIWAARAGAKRLPEVQALIAALALWTSALYVVLPETKARYAVYVFPAFLWLVVHWGGEREDNRKWVRIGLVALCLLSVLGALPRPLMVAGLGYAGSVLLWAAVVGSVSRA